MLVNFMHHEGFPARKRAEILREKLKVAGDDTDEGMEFHEAFDKVENYIEEDEMFEDAMKNTMLQSSSTSSNENVELADVFSIFYLRFILKITTGQKVRTRFMKHVCLMLQIVFLKTRTCRF